MFHFEHAPLSEHPSQVCKYPEKWFSQTYPKIPNTLLNPIHDFPKDYQSPSAGSCYMPQGAPQEDKSEPSPSHEHADQYHSNFGYSHGY